MARIGLVACWCFASDGRDPVWGGGLSNRKGGDDVEWSKVTAALAVELANLGGAGERVNAFAQWRSPERGRVPLLSARERAVAAAERAQRSEEQLPVVVRCAADAQIPAPDGVLWRRNQGRVRTALATAAGIAGLAELTEVDQVAGSALLRPLNDVAAQYTRLDAFRQRPVQRRREGGGVVIGIVDSGVDASLPCFSGRIAAVWDQLRDIGPGTGVPYGTVLRGPRVTSAFDPDGHGTHVAGIAAGAHPVYGGVAPAATLVVVRTSMRAGDITDAIDFVLAEAAALELPAVVNLSLGHHDHPHDGSDLLSTYVDDVTGPGRIVVAACGNEGASSIHGRLSLPAGQGDRLGFRLAATAGQPVHVVLTAWYDLPGEVACRLVAPDGQALTPWQVALSPVGPPVRGYGLSGGRCNITLSTPQTQAVSAQAAGAREIRVEISTVSHDPAVESGVWQLEIRNDGGQLLVIDAWLSCDSLGVQCEFVGTCVDNSMKVVSPGCSRSAVTVGAVATRTFWRTAAGVSSHEPGLAAGTLCDFSSPGPLRNGESKPDVVAPGAMIASAASSHCSHDADLIVDADIVLDGGTSMASPFVAGLVALMLQDEPSLDPAAIKVRLAGACAVPGAPPGTWHPSWGWGVIDAARL